MQNRCYSQSSKRNNEQTTETPVVTKYEKTQSHETFWNYICFQMKIFLWLHFCFIWSSPFKDGSLVVIQLKRFLFDEIGKGLLQRYNYYHSFKHLIDSLYCIRIKSSCIQIVATGLCHEFSCSLPLLSSRRGQNVHRWFASWTSLDEVRRRAIVYFAIYKATSICVTKQPQ